MNVLAYVLLGSAQKPQPAELAEQNNATSEAGRPVMWLAGSATVSSANFIEAWDKESVKRNISAGNKK